MVCGLLTPTARLPSRYSGGNHSAVDVSSRFAARVLGPMLLWGNHPVVSPQPGRVYGEADRPFSQHEHDSL